MRPSLFPLYLYAIVFGFAVLSPEAPAQEVDRPEVSISPPGALIPLGGDLSMEASVSDYESTIRWQKDGATIRGAVEPSYQIIGVTARSAGTFRAIARNAGGTGVSEAARVVIFERLQPENSVVVNEGRPWSMTVRAWGPGRQHFWSRESGEALDRHFLGTATARLAVAAASLSDQGVYLSQLGILRPVRNVEDPYVVVPEEVGRVTLVVLPKPRALFSFENPSEITPPVFTTEVGRQGPFPSLGWVDYTELGTPAEFLPSLGATTMRVTGLPPGMSYDANTNSFSGTPTRPGRYTVRANGTNRIGTGPTATLIVVVTPMPAGMEGSYEGLVDAGGLSNFSGGKFNLKISADGSLSGLVYLAQRRLPFSGRMGSVVDSSSYYGTSISYGASFDLGQGLVIGVVMTEVGVGVSGETTTFYASAEISGNPPWPNYGNYDEVGNLVPTHATAYRAHWSRSNPLLAGATGTYNVALKPQWTTTSGYPGDTPVNIDGFPQGIGFARVTIGRDGHVVWVGKLPDGSPCIGTANLSANLTFPVQWLLFKEAAYLSSGFPFTGTAQGWCGINVGGESLDRYWISSTILASGEYWPTTAGNLIYRKKPAANRLARRYANGFGDFSDPPGVGIAVKGRLYRVPSSGANVLNVPNVGDNVLITAGVVDPISLGGDFPEWSSQLLTLTTTHQFQRGYGDRFHPVVLVDPRSGLVTGTMVVQRFTARGTLQHDTVRLMGLVVNENPDTESATVFGGFELASLPNPYGAPPTTAANSPIVTYPFLIGAPTQDNTTLSGYSGSSSLTYGGSIDRGGNFSFSSSAGLFLQQGNAGFQIQ
jgi:hypothetical protein